MNTHHGISNTGSLPSRSLGLSFALILFTISAGIAVRFAPLGLPPVISKYGGSILWAMMVYWIVSTLLYTWRVSALFLLAGTLATIIEFFKLFHSPALDAFRLTLPGILLLGRFFSAWDIVAYWLAISAAAIADIQIRKARPIS